MSFLRDSVGSASTHDDMHQDVCVALHFPSSTIPKNTQNSLQTFHSKILQYPKQDVYPVMECIVLNSRCGCF